MECREQGLRSEVTALLKLSTYLDNIHHPDKPKVASSDISICTAD